MRAFGLIFGLFLACATPFSPQPSAAEDAPRQVDVFTSGAGGYHTYRIPSLVVTKRGTLLAICEGRKTGRGDHGDLDLVIRRSTDGGKTWSKIGLIYEEGGDKKITIGNPCPVVDQSSGTIWLPFTRDNDDVLMIYSTDDGATWSKPFKITEQVKKPEWGWYATGPGVGIQLTSGGHGGRLVIPCDHRERVDGQDITFSHCFFSDDHGMNWKLGASVAPHTNECQVVEVTPGEPSEGSGARDGESRLMINMRNYWGRDGKRPERGSRRATAISRDGGATWRDLRFDPTLIEPVCQASLIRYSWPSIAKNGAKRKDAPRDDAKNLLVFSNPASRTARHRLTIRLSADDGRTWPSERMLYSGSAAYSCLARLPDGRIGILFERDDYKTITFAALSLAWIRG